LLLIQLISNWTSCRTIQGVIMLVISNQPHASSSSNLEITHLLLPELYSTRSNYYIKPKVITLANHKCTHIEWIINSIKLPIFIYTPWRERGTVRVICLVQEKTKSLGHDLNPDSLIQSLAHLDDCNYLHNNLDLVHKNLFFCPCYWLRAWNQKISSHASSICL